MNKYKKLINNSIVFTIGSFGSKLISFFMVPLYTHLLSTNEYGTIDILNTTISLLIPLFTLELGQAAIRFAIDTKDEVKKNNIFSIILAHALIVTVIVLLGLPILKHLNISENYVFMFSILLVLRVVNNLFSQYIRGIGLVKEFAFNGILMTLVTVISNIILLVFLNYKVEGYIISLILATLISNIYMLIVSRSLERLRTYHFDRKLLKKMLKFSVPIVPNSAMWWITNSSSRYFILYFIGSAGNGIYAVANKIPGVISIITGIFSQAWQLSSFEEYKSKSKNEFYTKIFNIYWTFLFIGGSALLVILKPLIGILVEESFGISWQVSPMLIFAVIYQSFSTFIGMSYSAAKETKGAFLTSIYAGIISLITSFILIPTLGLIGAGLSSGISFFLFFVIRLYDTRKYVKININKSLFITTNFVYIAQTIILFLIDGVLLFIVESTLFLLILYINKDILGNIFRRVINVIGRQRGRR